MANPKQNQETKAGWAYHDATKHSFWSVRNKAHFLDWPNKPLPFKIYTTLDPIELPREVPPLDMPALEAISRQAAETNTAAIPGLKDLAQLLYYSAGVTKIKQNSGGEIMFRAAACTGALYEIELYLVCGDLPGLESGVYHFSPHDFSLRRLRRGDHRGVIARATAEEPGVMRAPVAIVCAGTYWRNAWKYQARTYRHFGWDNGTMLANLLATATALDFPARVVMGFVDEDVNRLLGLDSDHEVAFSMVSLGQTSSQPPAPPAEIEQLTLETEPLSSSEVDYPAMREMHAASSLLDVDEVRQWRGRLPEQKSPAPKGQLIPLKPFSEEYRSHEGLGTVILKRGSTRRFDRNSSVSFEQFSTLIHCSMREIPADFLGPVATAPGTEPAVATAPGTEPAVATAPGTEPAVATAPGTEPAAPTAPGTEPAVATAPGTEPAVATVSGAEPAVATAPGIETAGAPRLNRLYLIVHAVDGLQPGAYALDRDRWALELIKAGEFRREAGYLGLEQALPAEAAATIFFITDLNAVFERLGNRGYRAAQLEAGIIGGKMYLAAYAQGLGASGLTFYDEDVIEFFSPRAENGSAIFHLAIGKSARRRMEVVK